MIPANEETCNLKDFGEVKSSFGNYWNGYGDPQATLFCSWARPFTHPNLTKLKVGDVVSFRTGFNLYDTK
jgi:hypothetical protein